METRKDPKTWCDGGEFDSKRVANLQTDYRVHKYTQ